MIDHLTDSTTPRTARDAFGFDYHPPRIESTLARWLRRIAIFLLLVAIVVLTATALHYCGPGPGGCR